MQSFNASRLIRANGSITCSPVTGIWMYICVRKSFPLLFNPCVMIILFLSLCPVFQERPELPPTQAQATARSIPPEQYSYTASILRLLRNRPFIFLIITYGRSSPLSTVTVVSLKRRLFITMDDMKLKHLARPLVTGCSIVHEPSLLPVSK